MRSGAPQARFLQLSTRIRGVTSPEGEKPELKYNPQTCENKMHDNESQKGHNLVIFEHQASREVLALTLQACRI